MDRFRIGVALTNFPVEQMVVTSLLQMVRYLSSFLISMLTISFLSKTIAHGLLGRAFAVVPRVFDWIMVAAKRLAARDDATHNCTGSLADVTLGESSAIWLSRITSTIRSHRKPSQQCHHQCPEQWLEQVRLILPFDRWCLRGDCY